MMKSLRKFTLAILLIAALSSHGRGEDNVGRDVISNKKEPDQNLAVEKKRSSAVTVRWNGVITQEMSTIFPTEEETMEPTPPPPKPKPTMSAAQAELFRKLNQAQSIYNYISYTLIFPALIFNSLSLAVFTYRYRHNRAQTGNILLMALAVSDMLALTITIDTVIHSWTGRSYSLMQHTMTGCKLFPYITAVAKDCSCYIILMFTLERFISVYFPLKKSLWITRKTIVVFLVVTAVCFLGLESYRPYVMHHVAKFDRCGSRVKDTYITLTVIIHYGIGFILPSSIVAILNILLVRTLLKVSARRAKMTAKDDGSMDKQNRSLTIMLVTISTFSALVNLPKTYNYIYLYYHANMAYTTEYIQLAFFTDAISILNYSCNFFFYCLSGSQFRRDFVNMMRAAVGLKQRKYLSHRSSRFSLKSLKSV